MAAGLWRHDESVEFFKKPFHSFGYHLGAFGHHRAMRTLNQ